MKYLIRIFELELFRFHNMLKNVEVLIFVLIPYKEVLERSIILFGECKCRTTF
nr:hypothetical protein [uncultured bacterium]